MIRRSPAERYIKFLIVHPDNYDTITIRDIIYDAILDYPGDEYIERLAKEMSVPRPFYPTNRLHKRSYQFLLRSGVFGFFHPDKFDLRAHQFLKSPRAKEVIETMAMAGEEPSFISHRLEGLRISSTPTAVERYLTYYFDLRLVDTLELRALIRMRVEHLAVREDGRELSVQERRRLDALRKSAWRDPRVLICDHPQSPLGVIMSRLRSGHVPARLDIAKIAHATRIAALARCNSEVMDGGQESSAHARDFAIVAQLMAETITSVGSPDVNLQKDLHALVVSTETSQIPSLKQLTAGGAGHTTEIQPSTTENVHVDPGSPK